MIKPVDVIPENQVQRRESYRENIRKDIQAAMDQGIRKFEFVGEYNFKTLAQTAREEADRMTMMLVAKWSREHPEYKNVLKYKTFRCYEYRTMEIIKISSIKGDEKGTRRVFCEIAENMDTVIQTLVEKKLAAENRKGE